MLKRPQDFLVEWPYLTSCMTIGQQTWGTSSVGVVTMMPRSLSHGWSWRQLLLIQHPWKFYCLHLITPLILVIQQMFKGLVIVDSGAKEEAEEGQKFRSGQEVICKITCIFRQPNLNKQVAHRRKTNVMPESTVTRHKANLARNTQQAGLLHSQEPDTGEAHQ